jgi:hypothetical protein
MCARPSATARNIAAARSVRFGGFVAVVMGP